MSIKFGKLNIPTKASALFKLDKYLEVRGNKLFFCKKCKISLTLKPLIVSQNSKFFILFNIFWQLLQNLCSYTN